MTFRLKKKIRAITYRMGSITFLDFYHNPINHSHNSFLEMISSSENDSQASPHTWDDLPCTCALRKMPFLLHHVPGAETIFAKAIVKRPPSWCQGTLIFGAKYNPTCSFLVVLNLLRMTLF